MIVESVVDLFFALMSQVFAGFELIGLPYQVINTLQTIMVYGTWIVGADILAIFIACVSFWWTLKFVVGLFILLWELLPIV